MQDPNFKHTVILLVEHTSAGALGFIVNRQGAVKLRELVQVENIEIPPQTPAWFGGPVDPHTGVILHSATLKEDPTLQSYNQQYPDAGLTISASDEALVALVDLYKNHADLAVQEKLEQVIDHQLPLYPFRFLVGYAAWTAGQLDNELKSGAWMEMPFDRELLTNVPWQNIWETAMQSIGAKSQNFAFSQQTYLN